MLTDEGHKYIKVTTTDGKEHEFEPRDSDDMVGMMQTGMYVVFDRIDLVMTANGMFRPNKAKAIVQAEQKKVLFERAMFAPANIIRIDYGKPEIEEDSMIISGKDLH